MTGGVCILPPTSSLPSRGEEALTEEVQLKPGPSYDPRFLEGGFRQTNTFLSLGLVMAVVALVMVILAFITPWWSWRGVGSIENESHAIGMDLYFGDACVKADFDAFYPPESNEHCQPYNMMPSTQRTLGLTQVLLIFGLFFSVMTIFFVVQSLSRHDCKIRALVSGIICAVFLLMSAAYIVANLPVDLTSDGIWGIAAEGGVRGFFGSTSGRLPTYLGMFTFHMEYGGGVGWYMVVASSLLTLTGVALAFIGARSIQKAQRMIESDSTSVLGDSP